MEMGLTEGEEVEVVRFAPMGDPMEIRIQGYHLSLRREEARTVHVEGAK
jgi:Fe2+ transport system protein FeoA